MSEATMSVPTEEFMGTPEPAAARVEFHVATNDHDFAQILALRNAVYVEDQGRLGSVEDTAATFDRYDDHASYIVCRIDDVPSGAVKVVEDSPLGLPCENFAEVSRYRKPGHKLVEFGHLLSVLDHRTDGVGPALMREALIFAVRRGATHVFGDFFLDKRPEATLHPFYCHVGFVPACEPYIDPRFSGSPLSIVGVMEIAHSLRLWQGSKGARRRLLDFFYHDYSEYSVLDDASLEK